MGIGDRPTAPASPWENGYAERLIGSIRRGRVDHIIILGEARLRRILRSYAAITTASERIGRWTKMRRSLVRFTRQEALNHTPSLADFTTTTPELKFSVHTGIRFASDWPDYNPFCRRKQPPQSKDRRAAPEDRQATTMTAKPTGNPDSAACRCASLTSTTS
jgi:hypothetical protein